VLGVPDAGLERENWQYSDLHRFVRERNGFLVLAHPFRYRNFIAADCEHYRPDAIEICSANTPVAERDRIRDLAKAWNIPTLSNSDAHSTERLGT
jgi:PHP family Zn ribbon phosphoesterase